MELIRPAVGGRAGSWADLGAGRGMFTRALVELLGPDSHVVAVDRDASALAALRRWASKQAPRVTVVDADFTRPPHLPAGEEFDGMLFGNALHFVEDPAARLADLVRRLRPTGRVVVVEYDRRGPNRWVPYPIPAARWSGLAVAAGLSAPAIAARRPSAFGGDLYVAIADRAGR